MFKDFLNYICCPVCKSDLLITENILSCQKCCKEYLVDDGIIKFDSSLSSDLLLSAEKWNKLYDHQLMNGGYIKEFDNYNKTYSDSTIGQILDVKSNRESYLEIGCGPFFNGVRLGKEFSVIIGIDICLSSLVVAKRIFLENNIKNYILIQGDILNMPIKENTIDFIYGGGVIEHFKNTMQCVKELYRCLKNSGISMNTIPYLNIGSLTYRQIWGNIPNFPIIREMAEIVHLRLLRGKHMTFGYEYSFTMSGIKRVHVSSGFKKNKIKVEKLEVNLIFEFLPARIRCAARYLASHSRLFWPMIKIIAMK